MAAYVDQANWRWRGERWCHLLADSLDELHEFAQGLGIPRERFQCPPKVRLPHYDLVESKRVIALRNGAISVERRMIVMKARALRQEYLQRYSDQASAG